MIKIKLRRLVFKLIVTVAVFSGCLNNPGTTSSLAFKKFSIRVDPSDSITVVTKSEDDYTGSFMTGSDTVYFNFGYDVKNLAEKDPSVIYYPYNEDSIRKNLDTSLVNGNEIVYTKKINFDIDEFRRQNVYFELISGYKAKITLPRKIQNGGITGIYVDSLRKDDGGRLKFNLYAKNLDSVQNQSLLKAIRSIQFHL